MYINIWNHLIFKYKNHQIFLLAKFQHVDLQTVSFNLTILGSSSATPTASRNPSAQFLEIYNRYFLIDCGEGTQIQLRRYHLKMNRIDHVFISHLHGDHVLGLPGFLSSLHLTNRTHPLHLYCHQPLKEILELQFKHSQTYLNFEIVYHFHESINEGPVYEDDKVEICIFPLKHRIPCVGFLFKEKPPLLSIRKDKIAEYNIQPAQIPSIKKGNDFISENGKLILNSELTFPPGQPSSYAYCSDTIYDTDLSKFISDVTWLYHESTFLKDHQNRATETYHSTAEQAAQIARLCKVKNLILGHFSARYRNLDEFIAEASEIFAPVFLATEGNNFKF